MGIQGKKLRRRRVAIAALTGLSLMATAACGGDDDASVGSETVAAGGNGAVTCDKDKAAAEGKVVFYNGDKPNQTEAIQEGFSKAYPGVKIESQTGQGKDAREKVIAEHAAGKIVGDVVMAGGNTLADLDEAGYLEHYRTAGLEDVVYEGLLTDKGYDNPRDVNVYGLTFNTNVVTADKRPDDWEDMTDPQYKGMLASQDPRGSGGALYVFAGMLELYGEDFMNKLGTQDVFFGPSNSQLVTDLVRGEHGIILSNHAANAYDKKQDGAPVDFVQPKSGVVLIPISMAVVKDAPHPVAARCFVDWSMSKEGAEALASVGETPARKDVAAEVEQMDITQAKILQLKYDASDPAQTAELTKKWDAIFFKK